jgi:hypothetical protein
VSDIENGPASGLSPKFAEAIERFDAENARDPHHVLVEGVEIPHELAYSRWLTDWVLRLCPGASEELRLAARAQHLRRWEIPRSSHPQTRPGYLQWREKLKRFHAQTAGEILLEVGYSELVVGRVRELILKKNITTDAEGRTLEDALCLVFLERQLDDLTTKTDRETLVGALRKAWNKMSPLGQQAALRLPFTPEQKELLDRALGNG